MTTWHSVGKTFALLTVGAIAGACMVNTSSSQNVQRAPEGTEVGRYQIADGSRVFDTKTARCWQFQGNSEKWTLEPAPWEWNQQHPKSQPKVPLAPSGFGDGR
jgi:hypothetical protein